MELRTFGSTRRQVAAIGQGSWQIESTRKADAVAALRAGLDLGLSHIDTAEMYGDGASEQYIAEAIRGRRAEVFLVSKVLPSNASARRTVQACERSLKNLGTDHLDCYLLHWRGDFPLEETLSAFSNLKRAGKIRSWGVSNFDVADLEEATAIAGEPACNQVLYHIAGRAIEHEVLPWCALHHTAVVAYTPFGRSTAVYEGGNAGARLLQQIAHAHEATPRQVALRFLLRDPNVFVIPKAARLEHVSENAGTMELELTQVEIAAIDQAFKRGARRGLPMN